MQVLKRIREWIAKHQYQYVGMVEERSVIKETGDDRRSYWVLSQDGFGHRRASRMGGACCSAFGNYRRAQVEAWKKGGPIPKGLDHIAEASPPKNPKLNVVPLNPEAD